MYSLIFSKRFVQVGVAADPESIPGTPKREYTLKMSQDIVYKHTWLKYTKITYNNMKVVACSFLLCCLWAWPFHDFCSVRNGNRHLFRLWSFSPSLAVGLAKHANIFFYHHSFADLLAGLFTAFFTRYFTNWFTDSFADSLINTELIHLLICSVISTLTCLRTRSLVDPLSCFF